MALKECIVDRKALQGFQRRAYKVYPNEHAEVMVGVIRRSKVRVTSFKQCDYSSNRDAVYIDDGYLNEHRQALGTAHTHPNCPAEPSKTDIESSARNGETIFAICSIRRRVNRWFVQWSFFDGPGRKLELTICDGAANPAG